MFPPWPIYRLITSSTFGKHYWIKCDAIGNMLEKKMVTSKSKIPTHGGSTMGAWREHIRNIKTQTSIILFLCLCPPPPHPKK